MPALALAGWLVAGVPLLLLGRFTPLPAFALGGALAAALCWYGPRVAIRREAPEATAWQVSGVLVVAALSAVFNGVLHSEQLIVRRDPGTYAQYAIWLAGHGSLPIPYDLAAFGGPDTALRFDSVGFYDHAGAVVPQFMPGAPLILAAGHWLGGVTGLLVTPAVLGALAVLTFAGVVTRLAGGRWAPLAALVLACALPIIYTSRTTFSEIPSMILLFGAVALVLDARLAARPRVTAALAGLAFGLAVVVRIDGLRDLLPVIAYAGLLVALRRVAGRGAAFAPLGLPLLGGLVAGAALGLVAAFLAARPYLSYLSGSIIPLLAITGVVLLLTAVLAAAGPALLSSRVRAAALTERLGRRLSWPAAALVVLVMAGFAVRPWLQTVHRTAVTRDDKANAQFIGGLQRSNGLPVDPTRLYTEQSLNWVIWYVGLPVVVLATLAAAVLVWRMTRGRGFAWVLPLAIIGWTTATTLWRPAITPDHPWASRRLVPVILPGLILLAVWGLRWLTGRARGAGYGGEARRWLVAAGGVLVLVPGAVTSIGTAFTQADRGEAAAIARMCAAIPADATVLIVERATADRFTQVVRGMCGVPAARVRPAGRDLAAPVDVDRVAARVRAAGRRPVVLAAEWSQALPYGPPAHVVALDTRQDERSLAGAPDGTWSLKINVWMAEPASSRPAAP
ncbi:hypothetical protein [Sphaerisporangium sp. TRM90804]|uniref:hypothetical protein n=1 Tax=Sphaerisporangium sp. TRM90804 TaxID=3031113 RepID=UPI0024498F4D|nr:hypothetical protein [Sphaerisporangium sp. TRM90804]MDH2427817.1 hypothetical protein [Sphaerisporangium sp. TRM90804]